MKQNILLIFLPIFLLIFAGFSVSAQITETSDGKVKSVQTKPKTEIDIATVDFKNFTFPDLYTGKSAKSFTLKNGQFRIGKQANERVFTLRKTYNFDITRDGKNEAINHIFAEICNPKCESQSLFYVYTISENQPKVIWKIATGANNLCGLKAVSFKIREIILEVFGNCLIQNDLIKPDNSKTNSGNVTRFSFSFENGLFVADSKEIITSTEKYSIEYRPKITFGEQ